MMEKNAQPLFVQCATHKTSNYQFISLQQEILQNRLLCAECLIPEQQGNIKKELIDLIPLSIAINSPESLLNWMKQFSNSFFLKRLNEFSEKDLKTEFNEKIQNFDKIIKIFEDFKQKAQEQLKQYLNIQEQFKEYRKQFLEDIKYAELREKLLILQGFQEQYSDQYIQVEKEFNNILNEILKDNGSLISNKINKIKQIHQNLKYNLQKPLNGKLQRFMNQILQQYEQFIEKLNKEACQHSFSQLLTSYFWDTLEQKIVRDSKKKIKQRNLIYQGSKHGLRSPAFWNKVNGKKDLLMIFQSKNKGNYVFGGYSPCQWQYNLNAYVQDNTQTSFLFSQTHDEIYPLKQAGKDKAICCWVGFGPLFGGGYDIRIDSDFNQGFSNLGNTYQWDNPHQGQQNNHLFGGGQPNIKECEIYELILE